MHGHGDRSVRLFAAAVALGVPALLLTGCQTPDLSFMMCPLGYLKHNGHLQGQAREISLKESIKDCVQACQHQPLCLAFEYSPSEKLCITKYGSHPTHPKLRDYLFCEKPPTKQAEKLLLTKEEYVEQSDAHIPVGGDVKVFALGSSNILWMTWIDQLHLYLTRLGFKCPVVPAKTPGTRFHPSNVQTCDDSKYFARLKTARLGKIGWNSWDFAYDGWDNCDKDGFRNISGHRVKCEHGPGCRYGKEVLKASDLAKDASKSDVTLVSTWYNDNKGFWTKFECFDGEPIDKSRTAEIAIPSLVRTVRSIHAINPDVWVLIMGKYPPCKGKVAEKAAWLRDLNQQVKAKLEQEPRTLFIDLSLPSDGEEMYQYKSYHSGHPNCRGSKLMAHAVLNRLFKEKVLARSLRLADEHKYMANGNCGAINVTECHTSALCWVDPAEGKCKPYSSGSQLYHKIAPMTQ